MLRFFSKKEYQQIATIFLLGDVKHILYFQRGFQTPKAVVTTPRGRFVVSRHKLQSKKNIISKSKASLQYEIDLLHMLPDLPVPQHLPSKHGSFIENYKDSSITVYKFLTGRQPQVITPGMVYQLGEFLGCFHKNGNKFNRTLNGRRKFYELTPVVMRKMEKITQRQTNSVLLSVVEEVQRGVEANRPPQALPRGPIHVDIKPENELFTGKKLTGVVDFGNFYIGPFVVDIGKTVMWNCCRKGKLNRRLLWEFMRGYASQRRLNAAERAYLKRAILFAVYSHIWVDLYHVPIKYVPEQYTLFLVKKFLPIARRLAKEKL